MRKKLVALVKKQSAELASVGAKEVRKVLAELGGLRTKAEWLAALEERPQSESWRKDRRNRPSSKEAAAPAATTN